MAQLSTKIKQYAANNGVASVDFSSDVLLQNDSNGQGPYIKEWNLNIAKPSSADLDAVEAAATTAEANAQVTAARKAAYGSIESQIEFITENGLEAWATKVAQIKADNPKQ